MERMPLLHVKHLISGACNRDADPAACDRGAIEIVVVTSLQV
jgi:hypothetical protein